MTAYSSIITTTTRLTSLVLIAVFITVASTAQNCPVNIPTTISSNPDTYFPAVNGTMNAGTTSISLGAVQYGTTPIATGDMLLIIQMQGAQINSANTSAYGDGVAGGSKGYLNNSELMAGKMEFVVATNAVPLTGGTLTLLNGTVNSYKNADFGTDGQYRFQVIRIGLYYNLTLGGTLTAPSWNGSTGGVIVLSATNNLDFNGQTITAAGAGFRGGGARQLSGATGGLNTDLVTLSTKNFNGSKGEGIAGTPRFMNNNGVLLDQGTTAEGYPGGSFAAGAPGNAGGGGTDGQPSVNDQNSGGGGGSNGGAGGKGGNSWNSNLATGGESGAVFQQNSPSQLVLGGGGGAGTTNNGTGVPGAGFSSSGAAGGGIVLLTAGSITGTGTINVNGTNGYTSTQNDGSGGGGAGGSVLIYAGSGHSGITVFANGGTGGSNSGGSTPAAHGPGGGGGGGAVYSNEPLNASSSATGGAAGRTAGNIVYGAVDGSAGVLVQNVTIDQVPPQYLNCSVLPANFKNVSAKAQQQKVMVSWQVTNEAAIKEYIVERSSDGIHFEAVGTVDYRYSSNGDNEYNFTDVTHETGTQYYRIKLISASKTLYSPVTSIKAIADASIERLAVTPNPAIGAAASVRFTVKKATANPVHIRMVSINGVAVWQKQYVSRPGINVVPIENIGSVPNGVYFVQYFNGNEHVNVKMLVNR